MNRSGWRRLSLLAGVLGFALFGYSVLHWFRWREKPDSATGVAVELRPAHQVIKVGETPTLSVTLVRAVR